MRISVPKQLALLFLHLHFAARFMGGLLGSWCVVFVWVSLDCIYGFKISDFVYCVLLA